MQPGKTFLAILIALAVVMMLIVGTMAVGIKVTLFVLAVSILFSASSYYAARYL